jgi:hypothetical protein
VVTKTQKNTAVIDAFQWNGGSLPAAFSALPYWAKTLFLHTPGDGSLHVPTTFRGTVKIDPTDWVYRDAAGVIDTLSNARMTANYT